MRSDGEVDWSSLPAPRPGLRCVIVVPARNESALLPRALHALVHQQAVGFAYEVIVLANNCTDDTAARARQLSQGCPAGTVHVVEVAWPVELAHVGRARRALMEVASVRLKHSGPPLGVIISTDADTRVADNWLAATVAAIDAGVDAVGGRIVTEADKALPAAARRLMRLDDTYRSWRERLQSLVDPDPADPWPRHHQHFGASLAVTAEAYRAVGGQPLVPFLEDEALVQALRLQDRTVRHCPQVRVHTSARLDGRAEVGLSWQLREWSGPVSAAGSPHVAHPLAEAHRWALRRRTRSLWHDAMTASDQADGGRSARFAALAGDLRLDPQWLQAHLASGLPFGRVWHDIDHRHAEPAASASRLDLPSLPMDAALRELRRLVRSQRADGLGQWAG
jgi:hypothetical protein